jgi:glycosyltransferase involved in cell wall biosynthesis
VIAAGDSARSVATNKLYEYLAAGRPVLVLGDDSQAARTVQEAGCGIVAPAGDPAAVADALRRLATGETPGAAGAIEQFSWPVLAERFDREIEAAVGAR